MMSSFDLNRVPYNGIFSLRNSQKSHGVVRVRREPNETQELCVWRGKPESNAQNEQVHNHH